MEKEEKTRCLCTAKIGEKGQIVLSKEVRDMFNLKPGDTLMVAVDKNQGIAMTPVSFAEKYFNIFAKISKEAE